MGIKIEKQWVEFKYPCLVTINTEQGFRCGYVGVPKNHILHGVSYADRTYYRPSKRAILATDWSQKLKIKAIVNSNLTIDIQRLLDVHGGITFTEYMDKSIKLDNPDYYRQHWFFGYDCGHAGDRRDMTLIEDERIRIVLKNFKDLPGTIKTKKYCIDECKSLARQLNLINSDLASERIFDKYNSSDSITVSLAGSNDE